MILTKGEKMRVFRKRNGLTQRALGDSLGLSCPQINVSLMERGVKPIHALGPINDINPSLGEQAMILRKRSGDTIREAASKVGKSHVWVIAAERDLYNPKALLDLYKNYRKQ
jgi:DNA-binding XRE family transcriptional regulator